MPRVKDPRPKLPAFCRPPAAREVFTKETKAKFDKLPGYARHFVKQFVDTGNLSLSAKQAGMSARGDELDEAKNLSAQDALEKYGMGLDEIMICLRDCMHAEKITRDSRGNNKIVVDLKLRLETIRLILQIRGDTATSKKDVIPILAQQPPEAVVDLFEKTDPDAKD